MKTYPQDSQYSDYEKLIALRIREEIAADEVEKFRADWKLALARAT